MSGLRGLYRTPDFVITEDASGVRGALSREAYLAGAHEPHFDALISEEDYHVLRLAGGGSETFVQAA
jgi:hypothetical protein